MKKEGTEDDLHKSKGSRACLTACLAALVRPWIMLQPPLPKSMCVPRCCSLPQLYCCCCLKCSVAVAVAIIKNVHFAFAAGALKSLAATKWKQSIITVQRRRVRGVGKGVLSAERLRDWVLSTEEWRKQKHRKLRRCQASTRHSCRVSCGSKTVSAKLSSTGNWFLSTVWNSFILQHPSKHSCRSSDSPTCLLFITYPTHTQRSPKKSCKPAKRNWLI